MSDCIFLYSIDTYVNFCLQRSFFILRKIKRDDIGIIVVVQKGLVNGEKIRVAAKNHIDTINDFLVLTKKLNQEASKLISFFDRRGR